MSSILYRQFAVSRLPPLAGPPQTSNKHCGWACPKEWGPRSRDGAPPGLVQVGVTMWAMCSFHKQPPKSVVRDTWGIFSPLCKSERFAVCFSALCRSQGSVMMSFARGTSGRAVAVAAFCLSKQLTCSLDFCCV